MWRGAGQPPPASRAAALSKAFADANSNRMQYNRASFEVQDDSVEQLRQRIQNSRLGTGLPPNRSLPSALEETLIYEEWRVGGSELSEPRKCMGLHASRIALPPWWPSNGSSSQALQPAALPSTRGSDSSPFYSGLCGRLLGTQRFLVAGSGHHTHKGLHPHPMHARLACKYCKRSQQGMLCFPLHCIHLPLILEHTQTSQSMHACRERTHAC